MSCAVIIVSEKEFAQPRFLDGAHGFATMEFASVFGDDKFAAAEQQRRAGLVASAALSHAKIFVGRSGRISFGPHNTHIRIVTAKHQLH